MNAFLLQLPNDSLSTRCSPSRLPLLHAHSSWSGCLLSRAGARELELGEAPAERKCIAPWDASGWCYPSWERCAEAGSGQRCLLLLHPAMPALRLCRTLASLRLMVFTSAVGSVFLGVSYRQCCRHRAAHAPGRLELLHLSPDGDSHHDGEICQTWE